jgi:hypothetical protein
VPDYSGYREGDEGVEAEANDQGAEVYSAIKKRVHHG